jgi:hypothetical protein
MAESVDQGAAPLLDLGGRRVSSLELLAIDVASVDGHVEATLDF